MRTCQAFPGCETERLVADVQPAIQCDAVNQIVPSRLQNRLWMGQLLAQGVSEQHLPEIYQMPGLRVAVNADTLTERSQVLMETWKRKASQDICSEGRVIQKLINPGCSCDVFCWQTELVQNEVNAPYRAQANFTLQLSSDEMVNEVHGLGNGATWIP